MDCHRLRPHVHDVVGVCDRLGVVVEQAHVDNFVGVGINELGAPCELGVLGLEHEEREAVCFVGDYELFHFSLLPAPSVNPFAHG